MEKEIKKTYISATDVSFNVKKEGAKRHTHVSFDLMTLGGSMFVTGDAGLQEAIERHRFFKEGVVVLVSEQPVAESEDAEEQPTEEKGEETKPQVLEFASVVEGKDYIADTYGVSRSQLRTRAAIEAVAAEKGFKVVWSQIEK